MSSIKRTRHAVYDLKYHLVWVPKCRKLKVVILKDGLAKRLQEIVQEIAERYEFELDTMEVEEDHVHPYFLTLLPPAHLSANQFLASSGNQVNSRVVLMGDAWGSGLSIEITLAYTSGSEGISRGARRILRLE
jgi:putative transposase